MTCGTRFFYCKHCGNIIGTIHNSGVPVVCCGEKMEELIPGTVDAAKEKHVPVVTKKCSKVTVAVGEVEHPMEKEHYIMWIAQVTENRITRVKLYPEQATETRFPYISGATLYAYCNKHGLWKTTIK